jgi:hypothetical protein
MEERVAVAPLSRDEIIRHWLLNSAINCPVSLTMLFPFFTWPRLNLREIPSVQPDDYVRNLLKLFDSGMIEFSSALPEDDPTTRTGVARILDRFLALPRDFQWVPFSVPGEPCQPRSAPDPKLQPDFRLTPRGGELWEKLAQPEWDRFVSGFSTFLDDGNVDEMDGELISPNRDLLIAYMGWYPEVNHEEIRLDTIKWETHADHEVLYWKRLPFVCHALFRVRSSERRWKDHNVPKWFNDWWSYAQRWHKDPWDLPGWPSK